MALRFPGWARWKGLSSHPVRQKLARACRIEPLENRQMLTLLIDVRMADGTKSINVTSGTQQIELEVWAKVTGSDGSAGNEGLSSVMGSFKSSNTGSGSALVNLSAEPVAPFNATASSGGTQADLDGDGDLDVGSNNSSSADGFFVGRASSVLYSKNAKRIATLTATVGQLLPGLETDITFVPRQSTQAGLWVEDGSLKNGTSGSIEVSPFQLLRTDSAAPTATLDALDPVTAGATTYQFTVTYNDDLGISRASIESGDVVVIDPSGQTIAAELVSADQATDAKQIRATYRIAAPGGVWDGSKNGTYAITLQSKQVSDAAGKFVAAGNLGTFAVALAVPENSPTAALNTPAAVVAGGTAYEFTVTYSDDTAISRATLGDGDVTVTAPDGRILQGSFVSADQAADATQIQATYRIKPIGGVWDAARNGTYTVNVAAGQVTDTTGKSVAVGSLGTFVANVVPKAVLTSKGLLRVVGRNVKDSISLSTKSTKLYAVVNGTRYSFSKAAVKAIEVYALGGNDVITVGGGVIGSLLDGGDGKDTITGGDGNDKIYVRDNFVDVINGGAGSKNSARIDKIDKVKNIKVFLK